MLIFMISKNQEAISVYLPKKLAQKIKEMAKKEKRSASKQIQYLIEKGLNK